MFIHNRKKINVNSVNFLLKNLLFLINVFKHSLLKIVQNIKLINLVLNVILNII